MTHLILSGGIIILSIMVMVLTTVTPFGWDQIIIGITIILMVETIIIIYHSLMAEEDQ